MPATLNLQLIYPSSDVVTVTSLCTTVLLALTLLHTFYLSCRVRTNLLMFLTVMFICMALMSHMSMLFGVFNSEVDASDMN